MVRVTRKMIKGKAYYYLEHSVRGKDKRATRSKYLGKKIPKDVEEVRRMFQYELDKEKWFTEFDDIRRRYRHELSQTPESAREKELLDFSVRFTYNTQRIEGSTLTLRETAELLEHRIAPGGRPMEDVEEAEAHHRVFLGMLELKKDLSLPLVLSWHYEIFKETKPDAAGRIRGHGVRIIGSEFVPPSPVELQPFLREFFSWYDAAKKKTNPVELAALVHLKFVTIHPFSDGNGRISRLMMNFVLHDHELPMLNIEYKRRGAYYGSLERAQLTKDERPFLNWFFRRYRREFMPRS